MKRATPIHNAPQDTAAKPEMRFIGMSSSRAGYGVRRAQPNPLPLSHSPLARFSLSPFPACRRGDATLMRSTLRWSSRYSLAALLKPSLRRELGGRGEGGGPGRGAPNKKKNNNHLALVFDGNWQTRGLQIGKGGKSQWDRSHHLLAPGQLKGSSHLRWMRNFNA